jgi:hypothetical protein
MVEGGDQGHSIMLMLSYKNQNTDTFGLPKYSDALVRQ